MKKYTIFIILTMSILIMSMLLSCLEVNADYDMIFAIAPDPINVTFLGYSETWKPYGVGDDINTSIYQIELYQSTTYGYFGSAYVNDIPVEGGVAEIWYSDITTNHTSWDEFIEPEPEVNFLTTRGIHDGKFNFEIQQQTGINDTVYNFYMLLIGLNDEEEGVNGWVTLALDISYESGFEDEGAYLTIESGAINYQYIILLFTLIFIPSLIVGAIFSLEDLGFIGFLCGLNIMTGFTYTFSILLIPLWFLIVIVIIDIIVILLVLHGRGTI